MQAAMMKVAHITSVSSDSILVGMAVAGSGGFVGRTQELARLLAALEQAEQGRPAVVLVAGDAGVGKTRLLDELAHQARQRRAQVMVGGCLEVGDVGLPYVPVIAALRGFAAEADNDELLAAAAKGLPRLGQLLPELPDQEASNAALGEGLEQLQLFDAVGSLLSRLAEHAPLLLVLEDLHWADSSTRKLLAFLHQTLRTGRLLLVASYRSDELHHRHPSRRWLAEFGRRPGVARLELGPLTRAELAEHLAALRGRRLSAVELARIFDRSEGNPFYAGELLAVGADRAEVALPPALADVVLSRVETLSDAALRVLRVAAVAGRRVSHRLLVAAAGRPEPEVEAGLREAVAARLLVAEAAGESYSFRHALLQEACYGNLLPASAVDSTPALLGCSSKNVARRAPRRQSLLITVWPAMTWLVRWSPRCGRRRRPKRFTRPGRGCVIWSRRCRYGNGSPRRPVSPEPTGSICSCGRRRQPTTGRG
jgi:predicted ATPase